MHVKAPMAPRKSNPELTRLCIDTVRTLSMDAVQAANSGHPGTPMALAPLGYALWTRHLRHNPDNPAWIDRDRFVLSAGHASMFLYSLLHLTGYDLPLEELRNFRQLGSKTPGHPEVHHTPGVETTTGPLGQGVANSVGMAVAERWLAERFNRPGHEIVDHRTVAVCSDGDLMEGISHEAAAIAGHLGLGKLLWIFDDNEITIEGSTNLATSTDQAKRFEGYGWHVQRVDDGEDLAAIDRAIEVARSVVDRPSIILLRTTIAFGSPNKAGHHDTHGAPLGDDEIRATKEALGYPSLEPFHIEDEALAEWRKAKERGAALESEWDARFEAYRTAHPELAAELLRFIGGAVPEGWDRDLPDFPDDGKPMATRAASGKVLQAVAKGIPNLIGGSADLGSSNKSTIDDAPSFLPGQPAGRNFHFGIREHGMGGILNGMALHGGVRPYGATFLIFSEYMRPAIRMAAIMKMPVIYLYTHDSIGLGEDGPTHQPIEQLAALRAIPEVLDLRPGDAAETAEAWRVAIERTDGPVFMALTRQNIPPLSRSGADAVAGVRHGGYIFAEASGGEPEVILLASGSELHVAVEAREKLEAEGTATRVVSLPSWHLFKRQTAEYRERVLPASVPARVSVEAGCTMGWDRWIGPDGLAIGIDHFGESAPAELLFERFGFTADNVARKARERVAGTKR